MFRNYQPSKGSGLIKDECKSNESQHHFHQYLGIEHFKEAALLEQSYEKKARTSIKKYLKSGEEDPISGLIPKRANVDLKRNLGLKLEKLNHKTERAILDLLSKYNYLHRFRGANWK